MAEQINRRRFFKGCLSATALVVANPTLLAQAGSQYKPYNRVLLTGQNDQPVTSNSLKKNQCYIFNYPYISTPCFLINLGQAVTTEQQLSTEEGRQYHWPGGIGPDQSIVSFAAICAHKMSYPTKQISFINYRPEHKIADTNSSQQVIFCCSERSMYDPAKGAQVMSGPAPQPLTTIVVEYDVSQDHYYAVGTLGSELYENFFQRFGFSLALESQLDDAEKIIESSTRIYHQSEYSEHQQAC